MPYENGKRITLYFEEKVLEGLKHEAALEGRSISNLVNWKLKHRAPDATLDAAVLSNLEARARTLGKEPAEMQNTILREALGMMPKAEG